MKTEEKTFEDSCEGCLVDVPFGAVHCWRWVSYRGQVGYVGCHEHFDDSKAYWLHISRGGCRNPETTSTLRWGGSAWEVKTDDRDDRE